MIDNSQQAEIVAFMGATGCGKTYAMTKRLGKPKRKRTMFWSPKEVADNYAGLYAGSVVFTSIRDMLGHIKKAGSGPFHVVFKPSPNRKTAEQQFDVFCKAAKAAMNVTVIADELHTVMKPGWAPDGCNDMLLTGRAYGVKFFGLSQRPTGINKDFFSNCSTIRTGRLGFHEDARTMAKALGVPDTDVLKLTGYQFIEKNVFTGEITRG